MPASISMILRRRDIKPPLQEKIAYELGVILPQDKKHLLPRSYNGKKPRSGFGTRINLKKYSLTSFFEKYGYHLREHYVSVTKLKNEKTFSVFIRKNLNKKKDQLICFNQGFLKGDKESWGHCTVIADIDKNTVTMYNPSPKQKRPQRVSLTKLYQAIKNHYKGGIWVISDK